MFINNIVEIIYNYVRNTAFIFLLGLNWNFSIELFLFYKKYSCVFCMKLSIVKVYIIYNYILVCFCPIIPARIICNTVTLMI